MTIKKRAVRAINKPILTGYEDDKFFKGIIDTYRGVYPYKTPVKQYLYLYKVMDKAVREIEGGR